MKFNQAMMLAAGKGTRMLPLTEITPKPLLLVNNKPLIEYGLQILQKNNIKKIVVNASYLANCFKEYLHAKPLDLDVNLIIEDYPLFAGGGIKNALPAFNMKQYLLVMNSDIIFEDASVIKIMEEICDEDTDIMIVACNVEKAFGYKQYKTSDMQFIKPEWTIGYENGVKYFFGGYYVVHPRIFDEYQNLKVADSAFSIIPYFVEAIKRNRFKAIVYDKKWYQASYPEDLEKLNEIF